MADYYVDSGSGVTEFAQSTAYALGARVVPKRSDAGANHLVAKQYVWECTTAGTTAAAEPTWDASYTIDTSTEVSGTATFTCRKPGFSSGSTQDWTFATLYLDYVISGTTGSSFLTAGDTVYVASTHSATLNGSLIILFPTAIGTRVISVNTSTGEATAGATESTSSLGQVAIYNSFYMYGVTLNNGTDNGNAPDFFLHRSMTVGCAQVYEACTLNHNATGSGGTWSLGEFGTTLDDVSFDFINCTFKVGAHASQSISVSNGRVSAVGCSFTGTVPTTAVTLSASGEATLEGCDFSGMTALTVHIAAANNTFLKTARLSRCKLHSTAAIISNTAIYKGSLEAWVFDCHSGDVHTFFGYYINGNSIVSDTSNYLTAGAAAQSWKITTNATISAEFPFQTPWIDWYNEATGSAITPYFEVLRNNGSAAAYTDRQVWAEFTVKETASSTRSTLSSDRAVITAAGAAQAAGVGTASWTIAASNLPYSMKCDSGSARTPAESGHIRGRLLIGEPSIAGTLYLDPQIRT